MCATFDFRKIRLAVLGRFLPVVLTAEKKDHRLSWMRSNVVRSNTSVQEEDNGIDISLGIPIGIPVKI
ncbi:hypothetical protein [Pseudomonas chlororaphis]|uniref:hypothetical protein n=1 Tax=Pseudomonas chlororaphis TaxID=587753 RepID=UPI000F5792E9|nr:hypothetical protein [Pseudomonas chlororaphis]